MKKCPNCGCDVPNDNETCNQCGYSYKSKNKSVFTVSKSSYTGGSNTVSVVRGRGVFKFFISIFVVFFIIQVIFIIFFFSFTSDVVEDMNNFDDPVYYTCGELCDFGYVRLNGKCVCDNGDIYSESNGELIYESDGILDDYQRCQVFCDDSIPVVYNNEKCKCSNGETFDKDGNYIFEEDRVDSIISSWDEDISLNKTVTTVFCNEEKEGMCVLYRNIINDVNSKNNTNIYYFDLSELTNSQKSQLFYTYNVQFYDNIPYTFIMKDGKYFTSMNGTMYTEALENFLRENGVM